MTECPVCHCAVLAERLLTCDIAFGTNNQYVYNHCPLCGHLWLVLNASLAGQKFVEPSEKFVIAVMEHPVISNMIYKPRLAWLSTRVPLNKDSSVLDIGCGTGNFLRFIKKKYRCRCHGVDFDPIFELADNEPDIVLTIADFETLDSTEYYNLIVMFHLIEHLNDPVSALRKAYNLLAPGGYLCIETPASDSLSFSLFRKYWFPLLPPYHRQVFSRKSLLMVIADALPNSKIVTISNTYISGEVIGSINMPFVNYVPHPFQKRRTPFWQTILAATGITILTTLAVPVEVFVAGTKNLLNIAGHQRILISKG